MKKILKNNERARDLSAAGGALADPAEQSIALPAMLKDVRPRVHGKFLFVGDEKLYVRGVTYGTFRTGGDGQEIYDADVVARDFELMAENGVNAVRTYTVPPRWLLDAAQQHGLRIMVGLPWEQHVTFLDDPKRVRLIEERVRAAVHACAGHPAVLCYAIGNEIPANIARWYGHRRIERFLHKLYQVAKAEDPHGLVTYVNYPSTEYLDLRFLDFMCFNVYLESQETLEAYLARLQNIAGDRPLVMAEIGLDSRRNGEEAQARALDWQVRTAFAAGSAGAFVFAWTDEWHRGGYEIDDWDFGLTTRARQPKPALDSVRRAFAEVPFPSNIRWPRISVVVCSYNGERTIRDCFDGLIRLDYPDYEVIVVNDGSTDRTATIAHEFPFRVISTENRGLSSARNTGLEAATGEIVAYTDDDAHPDPHWLKYLAATFLKTSHAGVGGPNIAPRNDGPIAECVANAPGGPIHVLLNDHEAEHIPGCNMAFWKAALQEIGGFDPQYRAAGDDVDVCWRIQEKGWTLGLSPAAVVWHHRRNSVRDYWKQQQGYGRAESLLERKWPEKYNAAGHLSWAGRLYGKGLSQAIVLRRGKIYQGTWGNALFQSADRPTCGLIQSLPLMPEWYLIVGALAALSTLAALWRPMLVMLPLFILSVTAPIIQAVLGGVRASFLNEPESLIDRFKLKSLTALLHLIQPLARLQGRLRYGLSPWRFRGLKGLSTPLWRTKVIWSEHWRDFARRLESIEAALSAGGAVVLRGGHYDRWDLEVRGGMLGCARLFTVMEEHGAGKQLLRVRSWPRFSWLSLSLILPFAGMALFAVYDHALSVGLILGAITESFILRTFYECAAAAATVVQALKQVEGEEQDRALKNNDNADTHSAASLNPLYQPELVRSLSVSGEPERTGD
jgi:GT2 family glycosyltransferase